MADRNLRTLPLMITGADGRVGRLLRAAWKAHPPAGLTPIWCARGYGQWQDLLSGPLDPCPPGSVVLHLAADLSERPDARARSATMAAAVATAARQGRAKGVLFASTAAVYTPADRDLDETAACCPPTAYGQAKLAAETACRAAAGPVPVTALRIGNVVGASALIGAERPDGPIKLDPVPGRHGGPLRSWVGPAELARLIARLALLAGNRACLPPVLNLASRGMWSMAEMLDASGYAWDYENFRDLVLPRLTLDTSRLSALCPVLAAPSPAEMIADLRQTLIHRVLA